MKKSDFSRKLDKFVAGKGFYIALFLCVAIIGVASWAILFTFDPAGDGDNSDMMYSSSSQSYSTDRGDTASSSDDTDDTGVTSSDSGDDSATPPESEADPVDTSDNTENAAPPESEEPTVSAEPEPETPVSVEEAIYVWPVVGEILNSHSLDTLVYNVTMNDWRTHDGIDVAAEKGATVLAIASGTVTGLYDDDLFGTTVIIDHGNGLESSYSNLAALPTVEIGDEVSVGDVIGSVGSTAIGEINEQSHLHLSVTLNGESADPLNYLPDQP